MNDVLATILGVMGLIITVLGGLVKFLYSRINQVEAAHVALNGALRQEMQTQASSHHNAQRELWQELRSMAKTDNDQHAHMLERMSELPTRDEMKSDLSAMETRLMNVLRKEVQQR